MKVAAHTGKLFRLLELIAYRLLDRLFLPLDKRRLRRNRNIRLIPTESSRRGGKKSYAEWAHVIGIFQTLFALHLPERNDSLILDIGCGTGLLGIASEPVLGTGGKYIGIDISKQDVDFCRSHFSGEQLEFLHFDAANPAYAPGQSSSQRPWPITASTVDLVSALSVWTHLNESHALFYLQEVERVLRPGAKAIITFFVLDEVYQKSLASRSSGKGRYHLTERDRWIFDTPAYGSNNWFHPRWAEIPESAIGVTSAGVDQLTSSSGLRLLNHFQGTWKEVPGVYFQDVLVFQKNSE